MVGCGVASAAQLTAIFSSSALVPATPPEEGEPPWTAGVFYWAMRPRVSHAGLTFSTATVDACAHAAHARRCFDTTKQRRNLLEVICLVQGAR